MFLILSFLLGFSLSLFSFWLTGLDFLVRSPDLAVAFVLSFLVGCGVIGGILTAKGDL